MRLLLLDCTVIGFDTELYELDEQTGSQQLTIIVLTPPTSLTSNVTLQVTAQSGNASGEIHRLQQVNMLILCLYRTS